MNEREINVLLKKADELRSLFVLGQRVIPFLEEIFVFVSEIQPLIDEINVSIEDNLKKMPNASKQLSKVTEATELATTEIMDIVDGVVNKTDIMSKNLNELKSIHDSRLAKAIKLLEIMKTGIEQSNQLKDALPELDKALDDLKNNSDEKDEEIINNTNDVLQSISMDSSSIMMSLQVQDITSQQIAAVNNLLETVQKKLGNILVKFQNTDISELVPEKDVYDNKPKNVSKMHREIAFDPDAVNSISMKHERQDTVDQYMKEAENLNNSDEDNDSAPSQEDIDAMFGDSNETSEESISSNTENDVTDTSELSDEPSQDDIDKLFNTANGSDDDDDDDNDEFSQDDIDKMFNS